MVDSTRSRWITETYSEKLASFAADRDVSEDSTKQAFRNYCETFRSTVVDGTSADIVRQLAFRKLQWHHAEPNGTG